MPDPKLGKNPDISELIPPRKRGHFPLAIAKLAAVTVAFGLLAAGFVLPLFLVPGIAVKNMVNNWEALPSELPFDQALPQRVTFTDVNGKPFVTLYEENRIPKKLNEISSYITEALLSTEDARFYEHVGIDLRGTARALSNNVSGGAREGGSTITQQYVKNILLYAARTADQKTQVTDTSLTRKIREARYAIQLEKTLTKDEILEGYLNTVYFGDGAYGIGAASQRYFGKDAKVLTIAESATLIGILKSPTNYNPSNDLQASTERRNTVISRMLTSNYISQTEAKSATQTNIDLNVRKMVNGCATSPYPMYCQWVKEALLNDTIFGETSEERAARFSLGGFTVRTALNPEIQQIAQEEAVKALGPKNRVAAGIAIVEPGTGHVAALATNKPWGFDVKKGQTELLLPTLKAYQPASNFKPIVLATALEQGFPLDSRFDTPNNYIPLNMNSPLDGFSNDDDRGHGVIDAYQATAGSVNVWFVKLIEKTGVKSVASMAERLGINSLPTEGPMKITDKDASLALGAYEVSPLELATVYATFDAHGVMCKPTGIIEITSVRGEKLPTPNPDCHQAISPEVADTVVDVLQAPFNNGTASRLNLDNGRPAAGKTGTTDNSAATWFTGFTPQYVTSIWVGDPRGGQKYPLKNVEAFGTTFSTVYGGYIAGPIWKNIMNRIHENLPVENFAQPGIVTSAKPIVPNVAGVSVGSAVEILKNAGFKVAVSEKTADRVSYAEPNQVFSQSPPGGGQYGIGTVVTLTLTRMSDVNVDVD